MKRIDWFIIVLIVVAFWNLDVWLVPFLDHFASNEYLTVAYVGICIGQINLIGAWGALTPGKVIALTPILGPPGGSANFVLVFNCLNLAQCVTVLATLLLLRGIRFKLVRAM